MRGAALLLLPGRLLCQRLLLLHLLLQFGVLAGWFAGGLLSALDHNRSPFNQFYLVAAGRIQ